MSKKGENIFKRKDGRWEGRYVKDRDLSGKAVYGFLYGKSYTAVKKKLEEKKSELKTGNNNESVNFGFGELAFRWLESKRLCVKGSTLARYKTIIDKHILPIYGSLRADSISADMVRRHINGLISNGYCEKTANDILIVIKDIVKLARREGACGCDLSEVTVKRRSAEIEVLTQSEQKRLCEYILSHLNNRSFGILLCLYTGIRIGEVCALKWSDVDMKEGIMHIDRTMLRIKNIDESARGKTKIAITPPKSEDSIREIPIPVFISEVMKKIKADGDAYVLTGSAESFIEPRNMQYYFKSVLKKCGLREVNFHILRHTFATRCVESGFEIKSLSEILGHSSVKITMDRYVHSSMDLKRKNMEKLNFF